MSRKQQAKTPKQFAVCLDSPPPGPTTLVFTGPAGEESVCVSLL